MTQLSSKEVRALGPTAMYVLAWMIAEHLEGRQQHQEKEIAIGANVSRNKVSDTMAVLESFGYATRVNRYGWVLSEGTRQLPLYKMLASDYPEADPIEVKKDVLDLPAGDVVVGNRTTCDSNSPSTTTVNPDIIQPEIKPPVLGADAHLERVEAACDECGIGEPARSEFARDKSITPEMVRYHCEYASAHGFTIGLAVSRLRKHWQIPKAKAKNVCAQTIQLELPEVNAIHLPEEAVQAWVTAREAAIPAVGMAVYRSFVEGAELIGFVDGVYTIRVGNQPSAELIRTRCRAVIEAALEARLEVVV